MIQYKCKNHNITFSASQCPICQERGEFHISRFYWCSHCRIPLYDTSCCLCKGHAMPIASDLRPVFPQERLLLEIILGKPFAFEDASVWNGTGNRYYVDGEKIPFKISTLKQMDSEKIRETYFMLEPENKKTEEKFWRLIQLWCLANQKRYQEITAEALDYIHEKVTDYKINEMFVSFSGGKDSTVVADLVQKAMGEKKVLHIFGDTTLEFPETYEYVERFKKEHPGTPVLSVKNKEKDFYELCHIIGPPSRVMRWCCTVFKTSAISRKIAALFKTKKRILTFYGIRRNESASRSKYDRESDSPKITIQRTISPIIDWMDNDVWLYILTEGIDFNQAYRYGYTRVGCWCCPNNSEWSEFLSKIYMREQYERFYHMLLEFAVKVGKREPENYVREGKWKARQGGNGLEYSQKSLIDFKPCALEENQFHYELQKPITEQLYEFFKPFGQMNTELGNKRLNERYFIEANGTLQLKLQGRIGSNVLKVTILNKKLCGAKGVHSAEEKVRCQITKYQMCIACNACEGICRFNAISINSTKEGEMLYKIDSGKCVKCGECINHFNGGCYMRKVLTIKR